MRFPSAVGAVLFILCGTASSDIMNGSFEQGLNHWTQLSSGLNIAGYFDPHGRPTDGNWQLYMVGSSGSTDYRYIASSLGLQSNSISSLFRPDGALPTSGTAIRQSGFSVSAGDTLSFDWNFLTQTAPSRWDYYDVAFLSIRNESSSSGEVLMLANPGATHYVNGILYSFETGFRATSYEFVTSGSYRVGFAVINAGGASYLGSALLIDNVKITPAPVPPVPAPVPVPGAALLGLLGLGTTGMRLRRKFA